MIGFFIKGDARVYLLTATVLSFLAFNFLQPAISHAGPVQWPQTGQQTCWDADGNALSCSGTGQDGDLKKGEAWPSPRFTATDNGQTITDNLTGLVWTKDANLMQVRDPGFDADGLTGNSDVTWQHALDYIKKLNGERYLGYNDWRLPNVKELKSLVNFEQPSPSTWLTLPSQGFTNVKAYYWSSSSAAFSQVWAVGMSFGFVEVKDKSDNLYVWPVRAGQ